MRGRHGRGQATRHASLRALRRRIAGGGDRPSLRRDRRRAARAAARQEPVQRGGDRPAEGAGRRRSVPARRGDLRGVAPPVGDRAGDRARVLGPAAGLHGARRQLPHPHRLLRARARGGVRARAVSARTSARIPARRRTASPSLAPRARTSPPSSASSAIPPARPARRSPSPPSRSPSPTDHEGTQNTLWRIEGTDALTSALADAELLIADGHHRYETARVYAEEVGGEGPHRYVLMFLVALEDPGLLIFPTHRLLTGLEDDRAKQEAIRDAADARLRGRAGLPRGAGAAARRQRRAAGLHGQLPQAALPADAEGPVDRRRRAGGQARALPPARHRRARGDRSSRARSG